MESITSQHSDIKAMCCTLSAIVGVLCWCTPFETFCYTTVVYLLERCIQKDF